MDTLMGIPIFFRPDVPKGMIYLVDATKLAQGLSRAFRELLEETLGQEEEGEG